MEYFEPNFLGEALVLLERFAPHARLLAGGTRLGPLVRVQPDATSALINLKRIADLRGVAAAGSSVRIGALVTAAELHQNALIGSHVPALAAAAAAMGARQLQSLATIGGNVCAVDGSSDLTTALLTCDAELELVGPAGTSVLPLDEFLSRRPPQPDASEILTGIALPAVARRGVYLRFTNRQACERALVCVACSLWPADPQRSLRIAVGGVGDVPVRARAAEDFLGQRAATAAAWRAAGRIAAEALVFQPDDRASIDFRRHLVANLIDRALELLRREVQHA